MTVAHEEKKPASMDDQPTKHGIGVWVAALFLLGAIAGAGIVAMPHAFLSAGWWAIIMVIVMSMIGCLTGLQLSWSWSMLQENWPEYAEHTRNPYPEIGFRAGGKVWKYAVQACVHCSMFGAAVAFLILSSQNVSSLVRDWLGYNINFCVMVFIISGSMLPFLFLGTPKDFWPIAVGAIAATAIAIAFIMIGTAIDMDACQGNVHYKTPSLGGYISAYCTISFAYGGHATFPTIQHDMRKPGKFPISVMVSFLVLFIMYFPMPVLAYYVYGHTVQGTIEHNLSSQWARDTIMIMITGHVLFAFFIVISPVTQDFERIVRIPLHFSWKRICTRTFMMVIVVFVVLTIPDFNTILELVGGTSLAATAYIFPGPFYLMLRSKTGKMTDQLKMVEQKIEKESSFTESDTSPSSESLRGFLSHRSPRGAHIPMWEYAINGIVVLSGLIGAIATVYSVFYRGATLETPCYLSGFKLATKARHNYTKCFDAANSSVIRDMMFHDH